MDPDFVREFGVLAGFAGLYIVASVLLLRGHKTDLTAVASHGALSLGDGAPTPQRLNRRRKAIARAKAPSATDAQD